MPVVQVNTGGRPEPYAFIVLKVAVGFTRVCQCLPRFHPADCRKHNASGVPPTDLADQFMSQPLQGPGFAANRLPLASVAAGQNRVTFRTKAHKMTAIRRPRATNGRFASNTAQIETIGRLAARERNCGQSESLL